MVRSLAKNDNGYVVTKRSEYGIPFHIKKADMVKEKMFKPKKENATPDTTFDANMQKMFGGKAHIL